MTTRERSAAAGWPPSAAAPRRLEGGFSLIEVMIGAALVLVMGYLVTTLSLSGSDAQKYAERMTRVTEITQDVVDQIRARLRSSVRVFGDDPLGQSYAALINATGLPTPYATRLPQIKSAGIIEPDTSTTAHTGSALLFARHAWTDEYTVKSGKKIRIDVYRMEGYYMAAEEGGPQPDRAYGLNLVRWVSEPLVDGLQVDSVADPVDQADLLSHLFNATPDDKGETHDPVEVAWKLGRDLADPTTLRQIDASGGLANNSSSPRSTSWEFEPAAQLSSVGMLYYRHHSVATNYAPGGMGVATFGILDNTGEGFPHGFETQVVGPATAREVLVHLTLVSTNRKGRTAFHDLRAVQVCRDL